MPTDIEIANMALGKMGARNLITSLSENSNEAKKINTFYEQTRKEILQKAHWGFAKGVAILDLLKQAPGTPGSVSTATQWTTAFPPPPWLYEYFWPEDALSMRAIVPVLSQYTYPFILGAASAFEVYNSQQDSAKTIVTNQVNAIAVYTKDVTHDELFDGMFVEAFSSALAAKVTPPLTGDKDLAKLLYALANSSILEARATDANQGLTIMDIPPEAIMARFDYNAMYQPRHGFIAPYAPLYMV